MSPVADVHDMTRAAFVLRGALAAGALAGAGAVAPFVGQALAQGGEDDIGILNFALTLEHLEAAFYDRGLREVQALDADVRRLAEQLRDDESAHVDALTKAIVDLGGRPARRPAMEFGDAFSSPAEFLRTANVFEDTGVSAYNGAAPLIRSVEVLEAAGAIVQVEARHAALIRMRRNEQPAPRAFDVASGRAEVLEAVGPFLPR